MSDALSSPQRRLLTSFFLFGLASPMVTVYANTFLWRQSQDPLILAVFNVGNYVGLALGFIFNALLLRVFESGKLYALGCLLQGVVPLILVSMGTQANTYAWALGLILGIAQGFFWSNRNVITSKYTQGPHRYRFISLETALSIVSGIISPFFIGWFIAFGDRLSSYTVTQAYQITSVLGFLLLLVAGRSAWSYAVEPFVTKQFFVKNASRSWNQQRVLELLNGIASGMESVLPLVIIFWFLGQEEAVGSLKALASILSAAVIFLIGKRVRHNHHTALFAFWILLSLTGALIFAISYSAWSALVFFILSGLVGSLRWSSFVAVMYEIVDKEKQHDDTHRFVYLLDREVFLNIGRILGLVLLVIGYVFQPDLLVRYGLIGMTLILIPALFLLQRMTRSLVE